MFEVLVSGMLCWKLEGVAAARFGSCSGLGEASLFLVARLLKDTRDVSAPTFLNCIQPLPPALAIGLIWRIQTIEKDNQTAALNMCLDWRIASTRKAQHEDTQMAPLCSARACKLGGFDLLHSIEDRSLHNAFFPKAVIDSSSTDSLVRLTSSSTQANRNASGQVPRACADCTTRLRGRPRQSVMQMQIKRIHRLIRARRRIRMSHAWAIF